MNTAVQDESSSAYKSQSPRSICGLPLALAFQGLNCSMRPSEWAFRKDMTSSSSSSWCYTQQGGFIQNT
eukprot:scaffold1397_cov254-Pinguiococcus_pyrenoidosus.AAC.3